ncbi:Sodium Bile acid symporter family protein, partial [Aphelenchoides avenae]
MPLWIHFLGYRFLSGFTTDETLAVRVPFWNILRTLLLTLAPLILGVIIAKYLPEYANRARRALRPFVAFLLMFLIVFGTLANLHMFDIITWTAALAGFLLPLCGFAFGCIAAAVACRKPEDIVTIAIETGVQHTGIAIMLLE